MLKILQNNRKHWNKEKLWYKFKNRHQSCSIKKLYLKNFAIFTGRYLCCSLFLIKLHAPTADSTNRTQKIIFETFEFFRLDLKDEFIKEQKISNNNINDNFCDFWGKTNFDCLFDFWPTASFFISVSFRLFVFLRNNFGLAFQFASSSSCIRLWNIYHRRQCEGN